MAHIFYPPPGRSRRLGGVVSALVLALTLAGCASVPPPDGAMNQAQAQLQAARDAGAADYDPVDLGFAQDKFQQAQAMMANRKYAQAADLADESRADATLARTKSLLGAARAQIQGKVEENSRLRSQNEQAQAEAAQHAAQEKAQVAAQQQAQSAANGGAPAPAASTALPTQAPTQNMPAPSSSVLSPPAGKGFQTIPDQSAPTQPASAQSTTDASQGGQP